MNNLPEVKNSITLKMLKLIFSIYVLVASSTTIIQMGVEYYSAKKNLKAELEGYTKMFSLDLAAALWDFDREAIQRISSGIMEVPVINGVAVLDLENNGKKVIYSAGCLSENSTLKEKPNKPEKELISFSLENDAYEFPIEYFLLNNTIKVGTIILHSDTGIIFKRLKPGFTTLIINSIIKSLALFIIFLTVGKILLTKPLSIIVASLNKLDFQDLDKYRPINIKSDYDNEFKLIEKAFNSMIERLFKSKSRLISLQNELIKSNELLEIKIAERTKELSQKNKLLDELSKTDPLTSVANRRFFNEILEQEYRRLGRVSTHLSLIICDIDYFKTYNDLYGHQAGDKCLKAVADQLKAKVKRKNDCVARYGGEEFAIVLPDTNLESAVKLAEKIRKEVEYLGIKHEKPDNLSQVVTISMGVACSTIALDEKECCFSELIERADKSLYRAKELGRNRVEFAD
ncbi:MAG: diguanylate cyclase [Desulfobacteraceae bacterium]|nr:diguanylate cyclase [Desulfobacteraceae bacterium]